MDQELKDYLEKRFDRIEQRFEQIDHRFEQIDQRFEQIDQRFGAMMADAQERDAQMRLHIETVEARQLTEFWKWARTADMRWSKVDGDVTSVHDRLAAIEDRVVELERRTYPRSGAA